LAKVERKCTNQNERIGQTTRSERFQNSKRNTRETNARLLI